MRKKIDIFVLSISLHVKVGLYEDKKLIKTIQSEEKSSEALPIIFEEILKTYDVTALYYVNAPGSFMSIKVTYIFLKTLSILKDIPLYATDGFHFNKNMPIKAVGKLYFVKIGNEIKTQKFDTIQECNFELDEVLDENKFSKNSLPFYAIGAV